MSINFPGKNVSPISHADRSDSETASPSRGSPGPLTPDMMTPAQSAFNQSLVQGFARTLEQRSVTIISPGESLLDEPADPLIPQPPASPGHWNLGLLQSPIPDDAALPYEVDHQKDPEFHDEIGVSDRGHERSSPATREGPSPPGTLLSSAYDLLSPGDRRQASAPEDEPGSPHYIIAGTTPPDSTGDDEMDAAVVGQDRFIKSTMQAAVEEFSRIASDPDRLQHYYSESIKDRMIASFPAPFLPELVIDRTLLPHYQAHLKQALTVSALDFEEEFNAIIVDMAEETARAADVILDELDSHYSTLGSSDREAIFRSGLETFGEFVNNGMDYEDARDQLANATHVAAAELQRGDQSDLSDGDAPPQRTIAPSPSPQNPLATGAAQMKSR